MTPAKAQTMKRAVGFTPSGLAQRRQLLGMDEMTFSTLLSRQKS